MKEKEFVVNPVVVNILAIIITIPLLILLIVIYKYRWIVNDHSFLNVFVSNLKKESGFFILFYIFSLFVGILIHEFIHGLFLSFFSPKGFKDLKFGFNIKAFAPYAHCKEPLKRNQYLLAVLAPGLIMGILPLIYCFIMNDIVWYVWSILFTISAIGDFMVFFMLLRVKRDRIILDHPAKVGFVARWVEE